ncbi:hypothetical protein LTR70_010548 [Exophiala xenobiotica]|uniref:Uncharacterized protein n=1 Tax=Lithohypha guttulata TaxID=1690604 RepID=A0ABR0JTR5_9EURO|nr:hypothetical protein LTR24_010525 [Lithohypha guttulata]KAK5309165.1 hypothetical protein LTR70_010548 [Exophiala xenobiotica]
MANNGTASVFATQWRNPTGFLSLLMIIGGPVIQSALAQLTGPSFVPICFSFGWVSYAFSTITALVGDGRLMPPTDYPCKVFNLETGYARTNRSWIIGRLLRDLEKPLSNEALCVSIYGTEQRPADKKCWAGMSKSTTFGLGAIALQIGIAIVPLGLTQDWGILIITASGTVIALLTAAVPQWRVEKFACRDESKKKIAITVGNGSRHVIVVLGEGRTLDLEDMAGGEGPRHGRPWVKTGWFLDYVNSDGRTVEIDQEEAHREYMSQHNIITRPLIRWRGISVGVRYYRRYQNDTAIRRPSSNEVMEAYAKNHNLAKQVQLFRGLPKPFWLTRLFVTILILLWTVVLISVLALKRNAWYLVAVGTVGMVQNAIVAAASREPDKRGIHLEKLPMIFIGEKVQDVLMDLDSWEAGCGRALLKEFFPAGLDVPKDRGEQDWWDEKARKGKGLEEDGKQVWGKQGGKKAAKEEGQEEEVEEEEKKKDSGEESEKGKGVEGNESGDGAGKEDEKGGENLTKQGALTSLNTEKKKDKDRYNRERYQEKYLGRRYDRIEIEKPGTPSRGKRDGGISRTEFRSRIVREAFSR